MTTIEGEGSGIGLYITLAEGYDDTTVSCLKKAQVVFFSYCAMWGHFPNWLFLNPLHSLAIPSRSKNCFAFPQAAVDTVGNFNRSYSWNPPPPPCNMIESWKFLAVLLTIFRTAFGSYLEADADSWRLFREVPAVDDCDAFGPGQMCALLHN